MQGPSWVSVLQLIPPNLHDTLALLTSTGHEVVVQRIMRLDPEYIVLKGRMAGTMDGGRVMIVPYDQINNIAFNKKMLEPEVQAIFGKDGHIPPPLAASANAEPPATESEPLAEVPEDEADLVEEVAAPVPAPTPSAQVAHPSKSVLLARLRARLARGTQ